jgi:hypothetical protein
VEPDRGRRRTVWSAWAKTLSGYNLSRRDIERGSRRLSEKENAVGVGVGPWGRGECSTIIQRLDRLIAAKEGIHIPTESAIAGNHRTHSPVLTAAQQS